MEDSTPIPRELKGKKLITFNLAAIGLVLSFSIYSSYAYYFYTYVIGLDALLSSTGMVLGLLVYAFGSPIFGVLSDNKKYSRFGKRRFFFIMGLPLIAVLGIIVWIPPVKCQIGQAMNWATAIYFWIVSIGLNLGFVMIQSPYLAMIPEQSETEKNRMEIATWQGFFGIFGTVIGVVLPMFLQSFLPDAKDAYWQNPSGQFLTLLVPIIGAISVVIAIICILTTYFSIDESFMKNQIIEKTSSRTVINQMILPFKHDNMRWFLMLILGFNMAMRVITTVLLPLLTIVIQLQGTEIILYIVVLAPFAFIGFFLWSKLESKIGLKKCFSISLLLVVILLFGSLILFAPIELSMLKIGGAVFIGIALTCLVGGLLFPTPLLSGIIDESARMNWNGTEKMGTKLSGAYFGINTFMVNIASSIANMILGVIFTGGNQSNTTLLILSLPVSGIFFFFAWFSLYRIHMRPIEINKQI